MSNNEALNRVKAFCMTNQMLLEDLARIGTRFGIDLGHTSVSDVGVEDVYYPQFDADVRAESAAMSKHYEVFYCLEKSIRALVSETIKTAEGSETWWVSKRVPATIQGEVSSRMRKEIDTGMTPRSAEQLDYTTFGELSVIINANWDIFGSLFTSQKAVEKVMSSLNSLRGPIAHCSALAEDEVVRLQLTVRDWFRLME